MQWKRINIKDVGIQKREMNRDPPSNSVTRTNFRANDKGLGRGDIKMTHLLHFRIFLGSCQSDRVVNQPSLSIRPPGRPWINAALNRTPPSHSGQVSVHFVGVASNRNRFKKLGGLEGSHRVVPGFFRSAPRPNYERLLIDDGLVSSVAAVSRSRLFPLWSATRKNRNGHCSIAGRSTKHKTVALVPASRFASVAIGLAFSSCFEVTNGIFITIVLWLSVGLDHQSTGIRLFFFSFFFTRT